MKALKAWLRIVYLGTACAVVSMALASRYGNDPEVVGYRGFIAGVVIVGAVSPVIDAVQEYRRGKRDA